MQIAIKPIRIFILTLLIFGATNSNIVLAHQQLIEADIDNIFYLDRYSAFSDQLSNQLVDSHHFSTTQTPIGDDMRAPSSDPNPIQSFFNGIYSYAQYMEYIMVLSMTIISVIFTGSNVFFLAKGMNELSEIETLKAGEFYWSLSSIIVGSLTLLISVLRLTAVEVKPSEEISGFYYFTALTSTLGMIIPGIINMNIYAGNFRNQSDGIQLKPFSIYRNQSAYGLVYNHRF